MTDETTDSIEPIGIKLRVEKYLQNFATITDGLVPVSILQRVAKRIQKFANITDGYTGGLAPVGI